MRTYVSLLLGCLTSVAAAPEQVILRPKSVEVLYGESVTCTGNPDCDLEALYDTDEVYLKIDPGPHTVSAFEVMFQLDDSLMTEPFLIQVVSLELAIDDPDYSNWWSTIYAWHWDTCRFERLISNDEMKPWLDGYLVATSVIVPTADTAKYVNSDTRQVVLRIMHSVERTSKACEPEFIAGQEGTNDTHTDEVTITIPPPG